MINEQLQAKQVMKMTNELQFHPNEGNMYIGTVIKSSVHFKNGNVDSIKLGIYSTGTYHL